MLKASDLEAILPKIRTRTDKILICLAVEANVPKSVEEIRNLARPAGETDVTQWKITTHLKSKKGFAIHTGTGWKLTTDGFEYVRKLVEPQIKVTVTRISNSLRDIAEKLRSKAVKEFVKEAIGCYESGYYRAAIVLSWIGAVSVLYDFVLNNRLAEFNAEALRRYPKWKEAKTADDLAIMKEFDFLNVLVEISVLGKSVKDELDARLRLRNGSGHPNTLRPEELVASAHIESIVNHVFAKFA